jgi:diguanylate cyclase (GGDEF)-like protein
MQFSTVWPRWLSAGHAAVKAPQKRIYRHLAAATLLAGLAALGLWNMSHRLARDIAMQQSIAQSQAWQHRIIGMLERGSETFLDRRLSDADRVALDHFIRASSTYRYILFGRDGVAFMSSAPKKIGARVEGDYFDKIIRLGGIYAVPQIKSLADIDKVDRESGFGSGHLAAERHVSEVYVPVFHRGEFVGAIEHYKDNTDLIGWYTDQLRLVSMIFSGLVWAASATVISLSLSHAQRREADLQRLNEAQLQSMRDDRRRSTEARLLAELNEWLQSSRSLDELYRMVATFVSKLVPTCSGQLYIYSSSRDVLDGVATWNGGTLESAIHADDRWGLRRGRTYHYGTNEIDFICQHVSADQSHRYCCIPILAHGETIGLLHMADTHARHEDAASPDQYDQRRLISVCAEHISLAIANVRLREQLRDQSIRDSLTGLFNRRYMLETLRREIGRATRKNEQIGLLSIDVDFFKRFNDNHGHDAGDTVLRVVAERMTALFRDDDIVCRHGGEEFVILLPGATTPTVLERAEVLRAAIEKTVVRYGEDRLPPITVSVGVAVFPADGRSPHELLKVADDALYRAKAAGRNRVEISGPAAPRTTAEADAEALLDRELTRNAA